MTPAGVAVTKFAPPHLIDKGNPAGKTDHASNMFQRLDHTSERFRLDGGQATERNKAEIHKPRSNRDFGAS